MIRRPPRSTLDRSSAASDVYKRQTLAHSRLSPFISTNDLIAPATFLPFTTFLLYSASSVPLSSNINRKYLNSDTCLLYTSDAADERSSVDLGGRRIIKKKK